MKFSIEKSYINEFLKSALVVSNEAIVNIDENGWKLYATDPANVILVHLTLSKYTFETYELDNEDIKELYDDVTSSKYHVSDVALDLLKISKLISVSKPNDLIEFDIEDNTMNLTQMLGKMKYSIRLMDTDSVSSKFDPDSMPKLTPVFKTEMIGSEFIKACDAVGKVSSITKFTATDDMFCISSYDSTDSMYVKFSDLDITRLTESDKDSVNSVKSLYSMEYIDNIKKAISARKFIYIEIGDDYPMRLTFNIIGDSECTFLLAPRIEE